jgi:hypothetical protein
MGPCEAIISSVAKETDPSYVIGIMGLILEHRKHVPENAWANAKPSAAAALKAMSPSWVISCMT